MDIAAGGGAGRRRQPVCGGGAVGARRPPRGSTSEGAGGRRTRRAGRPGSRGVADSRTTPAVGTVTADTPLSASPRSAVPDRHDFRRRLAGRRARRAVRPKPSACRSSRLARAGGPPTTRAGPAAAGLAVGQADEGAARSTAGSTSRPTTASASPGRSPRPPPAAPGSAPPPPAAVPAVAWQPHRPPPAVAGSVVNRCGGGWSAVADAPSTPAC